MHPLSVFPSSFILSFIRSPICSHFLFLLLFIFWRCQYVHYVASNGKNMIKWNGFGRKWSWSHRDTILEYSWRDWGKLWTKIATVQDEIRSQNIPNSSQSFTATCITFFYFLPTSVSPFLLLFFFLYFQAGVQCPSKFSHLFCMFIPPQFCIAFSLRSVFTFILSPFHFEPCMMAPETSPTAVRMGNQVPCNGDCSKETTFSAPVLTVFAMTFMWTSIIKCVCRNLITLYTVHENNFFLFR
jgi:hypothetical protein